MPFLRAGFVVVITVGSLVLLMRLIVWQSQDTPFKDLSYRDKEKYIDEVIRKDGPTAAYDFIKNKYPDEENIGHHLLHRVGEELYYRFGEDAFMHCDTLFGYGCFHGAVMGYVRMHGADQEAIETFAKEGCTRAPSLEKESHCFHGVGHALFDLLGALEDAFNICKKIAPKEHSVACYHGVAMEYVMGSFREEQRDGYIADANPYVVCHALEREFWDVCYREHIVYILKDRFPGQWDKAADYCRGIPDADRELILRCGKRIGIAVAGLLTRDIERGWELCVETGDLKTACAYGFLEQRIEQGDMRLADIICNSFPLEEQVSCRENKQFFLNRLKAYRAQKTSVDK